MEVGASLTQWPLRCPARLTTAQLERLLHRHYSYRNREGDGGVNTVTAQHGRGLHRTYEVTVHQGTRLHRIYIYIYI